MYSLLLNDIAALHCFGIAMPQSAKSVIGTRFIVTKLNDVDKVLFIMYPYNWYQSPDTGVLFVETVFIWYK